jgi:hypothetical protein
MKGEGLLAFLGKPKDDDDANDEDASTDAGQALLDAIEAKDADEVVVAFRLLTKACKKDD